MGISAVVVPNPPRFVPNSDKINRVYSILRTVEYCYVIFKQHVILSKRPLYISVSVALTFQTRIRMHSQQGFPEGPNCTTSRKSRGIKGNVHQG